MKHASLKTLGVTALGAAVAATGAGAASAVGVTDTVETASKQVLAAPPVQEATGGGDTIGKLPTSPEDVVSPGMADELAAYESGQATAPQLLGGLPVTERLSGDTRPLDQVGHAVDRLPTDELLNSGVLGATGLTAS